MTDLICGSDTEGVTGMLCLPGPWASRSELLERVVRDSGSYLFAGGLLMNIATRDVFELMFEPEPDPRMAAAFAAAGPHWRNSPEMGEIADHRSVVYLSSRVAGLEDVNALMLAGQALLDAGACGVKVESSGVAHSPDAWRDFAKMAHVYTAHRAFVVYVTGSPVASCGMHHFGLPDAAVKGLAADEAVELLRVFTRYLLIESPTLRDGHTFSVAPDAPVYRMELIGSMPYPADSLFHNPYGCWHLQAR